MSSSSRAWFKTASKFLKYDSGQQNIPTIETKKGLIESEEEKTEVLNDHFIDQSTINDTTATLPPFVPPAHETLSSITITQVVLGLFKKQATTRLHKKFLLILEKYSSRSASGLDLRPYSIFDLY